MENILLKNANLFCPSPMGKSDMLVSNGIISKIGQNLEYDPQSTYVYDCSDKIVCPMFVDGNALIVGKLVYSEKDFFAGGIGTVVGTMRFDKIVSDIEAYLLAADNLKHKGVDCYVLTDGINYYTNNLSGNVNADMASVDGIIGAKTALNSQGLVRMGNPNFYVFQELAIRCYSVCKFVKRPTQLMVHLERELKPHGHNLKWIDQIVENTGIDYSQFKLSHAEEYCEDVLEYAKKGCYVDFSAFEKKYDHRFDVLVDAIREKSLPLDNISISSNAFELVEQDGYISKYKDPKSILNTIKVLCLEKGLDFADVIKFVTSTPAKLIDPNIALLKEGVKCKALVLDKDFQISAMINYKTTI